MKTMKRLVCTLLAVLTVFGTLAMTASAAINQSAVAAKGETYIDKYGYYFVNNYGFYSEWCEQFVGLCVEQAGLGDRYTYSEAGRMMKAFLSQKKLYLTTFYFNNSRQKSRLSELGININSAWTTTSFVPKRGDVIFFQKGVYWCSHVGIVRSVDINVRTNQVTVRTVEGNCGDQVKYCTHEFNLKTGKLSDDDTFSYVTGFGRFN